MGGVITGADGRTYKDGGFKGFIVGWGKGQRYRHVLRLRLLRWALWGHLTRFHWWRVEWLVNGSWRALHATRSHVNFYVITGMWAERRGRWRSNKVCRRAVGVQCRGFRLHRVHMVQAGIRAFFLRSEAKPLGLRLQGLLLAHRVAVVKRCLWPLLLLLPFLQLLAQLVLGGWQGRLSWWRWVSWGAARPLLRILMSVWNKTNNGYKIF